MAFVSAHRNKSTCIIHVQKDKGISSLFVLHLHPSMTAWKIRSIVRWNLIL